MKNVKKLMISAVCTLALAACQKQQAQAPAESKPTPATSQASTIVPAAASSTNSHLPKYRVVVELDAPFALQMADGSVSGFDYDVLQAIGEKQGFTLEYKAYPWGSLFSALEKSEADLTGGGIYVTPERQEKFDFTSNYLPTSTALLVSKTSGIQKLSDIRGKKVAVKERTQAQKWVNKTTDDLSKVQAKPTLWLAFKEGLSKNVDAVVGDEASLTYFLKQYPDDSLTLIQDNSLPKEQYAFMLRKGQPELMMKLNAGLAQLEQDGTLAKLRKKWFEEAAPKPAVQP
ncbi:substrate-binding periplasmic protein [Alysiella crassa]|uniref:Glutamine-binding periplasmic protein n=1 Tax=Alysiella crassa TaxID=153491 RepID=A0A376BKF4_9NEIS|nr:transporter substrate-binding domain-containing protein [Alysiella crassa]UOP07582.1 transporter substrate-binding domain-containing protein [Alysiella crassa]SSY70199.1 Glutamine-binding periplasmic protein precursor [Alysiella crassa]